MGIDVSDAKVVTFNPGHERRVVTDVARKPPRRQFSSIEVASVFARKSVRHDNDDGNPLIYALKGMSGYTMPYGSFREIYRCGAEILPKALDGIDFDMIVPLPSSSAVAAIFAERASRCGGKCPIIRCLNKATFGQVLEFAPPMGMVEKRLRQQYGKQLRALQKADPNATFQMKKVKLPLRPYFMPVVANADAPLIAGHRILLVDDILGSGTSITAATHALKDSGAIGMSGLTLMGQLA